MNQDVTKEDVIKNYDYKEIVEFLDLASIEATYIKRNGVLRFQGNKIIRYLIDYHQEETSKTHGSGRGLNLIYKEANERGYSLRDFVELYIAMGYSLSGFLEVFGESIDKIFRIKYEYETGDFIEKLGPTEETIALIDKCIWETK